MVLAEDGRSQGLVRRFFCYFVLKRERSSGGLILQEMLVAAEKGVKRTHIVFGTNMNPLVLTRHLGFAVERGLLEQKATSILQRRSEGFLCWFGRLGELVE